MVKGNVAGSLSTDPIGQWVRALRRRNVTSADYLPQQLYVTTLWRVSAALNSSLDLPTVLRTATELIQECTGAERGLIMLLEGDGEGDLVPEPDPPADRSHGPTILQRALAGESVLTTEYGEARESSFAGSGSRSQGPRSVLCVPLGVHGRVIGALYLESRAHHNRFDVWHREMASAFANHAAVAIENARLYSRLQEDFEQQLRLERELAEAAKQQAMSEEANRAKSEVIAHVAHELRSPLNTIRGFTETLMDDGERRFEAEERGEIYETIAAEADRLLALISRMLDTSCLEAGRPLRVFRVPLEVEPILRRMVRSAPYMKGFSAERHRVELCLSATLPCVEADEDKLFQVLHNLVGNAIKCSPEGGTIRLDARCVPGREGSPGEVGLRCGEQILISVTDQGFGIEAEDQQRLFQPYCTLGDEGQPRAAGTGLGLYLSRYLIQLHGGDLWVESEPGKGSRFTFSLPL
jgi:signal transduction histidine kinase